jgi:Family of unknown function (DUF5684)
MEGYEAVDSGLLASLGAMLFVFGIIGLAVYIFIGWCMMKIADKTGTENGWWGFIPILNVLLILDIAEKPRLWALVLIGYLIPIVNILVGLAVFGGLIYLWMEIAEKLGKPKFWGIIAALFAPVGIGYLALSD